MEASSDPQPANPTNIPIQNRSSVIFPYPSNPTQVLKLFNTNSPEAYTEAIMHKLASKLTIGVVKYVDLYYEEGRLGIWLEACQWENVGQTRRKMIEEDVRHWGERELMGVARDMMKVVSILHTACIVHNNLGLDNWLLTEKSCLRLTDFGSAQHVLMPFPRENSPFRGDIFQIGANIYELAFPKPCRYVPSCPVDMLQSSLLSKAREHQYSSDLVDLLVDLMANRKTLQGCLAWVEGKVGR